MDDSQLAPLRRLLALAQTGLHFSRDVYDRQRYEEVADIAATLLAGPPDARAFRAQWQADPGYVTPKIEVRAGIFRPGTAGDEVLLVRETSDGCWTLPGGWADVNEGPRFAVEKEVREESGYEARAAKLAAVLDRRLHGHPPSAFHAWKLFFVCDIAGGAPRTSIETDALGFFPLSALPELSASRVTAAQIARVHAHHLDRARATEFD